MMFRKKKVSDTSEGGRISRCSFCNKSQYDVRKMIAGPNVYICDECVDICLDIVSDVRKDAPDPAQQSTWPWNAGGSCALCRLPVTVAEALIVENRGLICAGCRGEIEAALAREP